MVQIDKILEEIRDGTSLYWAFYAPDDTGDVEAIEVRLNASIRSAKRFIAPNGWTLHRIQWNDTLFIRRQQQMDREAIEEMLCEMLQFAAVHGMTFHSWQAGPGLPPDGFHP